MVFGYSFSDMVFSKYMFKYANLGHTSYVRTNDTTKVH